MPPAMTLCFLFIRVTVIIHFLFHPASHGPSLSTLPSAGHWGRTVDKSTPPLLSPISSFLFYHISPRSWGLSVHFLKFFVVAALVTLDPL